MLKLPVDASLQLTLLDDLGAGFVTKLKTASFFDASQCAGIRRDKHRTGLLLRVAKN